MQSQIQLIHDFCFAAQLCAAGYYRRNAYLPATDCIPCPSDTPALNCQSNATTESLNVSEGYWRLTETSLEAVECAIPSDKASPCKGGTDVGTEGSGYCIEGHSGPRCELCTNSSQYFSDGACVDCPEASVRVWFTIGIIFAAFLFVAAAIAVGHLVPKLGDMTLLWGHYLLERTTSLALIPKAKLVVSCVAPNHGHMPTQSMSSS